MAARVRQQQAIADFGLYALSETEIPPLYQAAVQRVADGLGVEYAALLELRQEEGVLVLQAWAGSEIDLGEPVTARVDGQGPAARAVREGGDVIVDYRRARLRPAPGTVLGRHGVASSAAVVIRGEGDPIGALVAHSTRRNAFGGDDVFFLRSLANILAAAVARQRSEQAAMQLAAIVEGSFDAIVSRDLEGTVLSWNAGAERLLGYRADEIVGRPFMLIVPPERQDELSETGARLRRGEAVTDLETVRLRKDGKRIDVASTISPILDASGRTVGGAAIMHDLSERKRLERQLGVSQRLEAVGRLAGGVAHDFNNLVTVIGGYTDVLLAEEELRPWRPDLQEIHAAAERAAALTRQLLAFARRQLLQPEPLDLNEVVTSLKPLLARLLGEDVELVTLLDPGVHPVLADRGQVEHVLMNLVSNAREAMPRGGKVTIETGNAELDEQHTASHEGAQAGAHAVLAVSDDGCGMDAETVARIFEPFFTTKEDALGAGLGLSTVYGIVKQSGGNISVYSEPGRGSTFRVYLPRVEGKAVTPAAPRQEAASRTGGETVLLVEDDDAVRALAGRMLQADGYSVLTAAGPDEALQLADDCAGTIDLLLTDLVLPGLNGVELAECLAQRRPGLRVLFMSGYSDESMVRNGPLGSETRFLEKPFSAEGLARTVRETLEAAG